MKNFIFRWDKFLTIVVASFLVYVSTNLDSISWTKAGLVSAGVGLVQFIAQALVKNLSNNKQ